MSWKRGQALLFVVFRSFPLTSQELGGHLPNYFFFDRVSWGFINSRKSGDTIPIKLKMSRN